MVPIEKERNLKINKSLFASNVYICMLLTKFVWS